MDHTHNYGAAFYSCAAGMGLGGICLAMVGTARLGMCQRQSRNKDKGRSTDDERRMSQDGDQPDFLEVDLALEDSPVRQAVVQDSTSVI